MSKALLVKPDRDNQGGRLSFAPPTANGGAYLVVPTGAVAHTHDEYATDTDLATHVGASDPHTVYQKESEKDAASGYVGIAADGSVTLDDAASPKLNLSGTGSPGIEVRSTAGGTPYIDLSRSGADYDARLILLGNDYLDVVGAELRQGTGPYVVATSKDIADHVAALDPHAGYIDNTELGTQFQTHSTASDPHTGYQKESEKGVANGYASLDGTVHVPTAQLGSGTPNATTYLRGDQTWGTPAGGGGTAINPGTATTSSNVGDALSHGGSTTDYAKTDHRHSREAFGPVVAQTAFGAASSDGSGTTVARANHQHGTPAAPAIGSPVSLAGGINPGVASTYARSDHQHGTTFAKVSDPSEGGEIVFQGAGVNPDIRMDNSAGILRAWAGASFYFMADANRDTPTTQAFGDVASGGTSYRLAYAGHKHGMPALPAEGWWHNVKDYGAVGNGTADDTAAIQAAINAAGAAGGRKIVFFPAGTYKITSTLTISVDGVHLLGVGKGYYRNLTTDVFSTATRIVWGSASVGTMIDVTHTGRVGNVSIKELTLDGQAVAVPLLKLYGSWGGDYDIGVMKCGTSTSVRKAAMYVVNSAQNDISLVSHGRNNAAILVLDAGGDPTGGENACLNRIWSVHGYYGYNNRIGNDGIVFGDSDHNFLYYMWLFHESLGTNMDNPGNDSNCYSLAFLGSLAGVINPDTGLPMLGRARRNVVYWHGAGAGMEDVNIWFQGGQKRSLPLGSETRFACTQNIVLNVDMQGGAAAAQMGTNTEDEGNRWFGDSLFFTHVASGTNPRDNT